MDLLSSRLWLDERVCERSHGKVGKEGLGPQLEGLEYQVQGGGLSFLGSGQALVFSE